MYICKKITKKFTDDFKSPKLCIMEKIYLQLQLFIEECCIVY